MSSYLWDITLVQLGLSHYIFDSIFASIINTAIIIYFLNLGVLLSIGSADNKENRDLKGRQVSS